jgi:hypothetical protein
MRRVFFLLLRMVIPNVRVLYMGRVFFLLLRMVIPNVRVLYMRRVFFLFLRMFFLLICAHCACAGLVPRQRDPVGAGEQEPALGCRERRDRSRWVGTVVLVPQIYTRPNLETEYCVYIKHWFIYNLENLLYTHQLTSKDCGFCGQPASRKILGVCRYSQRKTEMRALSVKNYKILIFFLVWVGNLKKW